MKHFLSCVLLLTCLCTVPTTADKVDLPNMHLVNMTIFRGAQPQPDGLKKLAEMRVHTIINLRNTSAETEAEGKVVKDLGLRYYNIPLPALSRPNFEQINQVLSLMHDRTNAPVFVHCKRGDDRTGTIIACYRMRYEGWTVEQAVAEARKLGMSRFQISMKSFLHDYYQQLNQQGSR
ncbi:MAG: dual specificity protein phosphatase family protein [Blastocatellia bacterium]